MRDSVTRGRQYELPAAAARQAVGDGPEPFNLMLRRPGSRSVFLGPSYGDPDEWYRRDGVYEGVDEREDRGTDWSLSLPHHCDEWPIGVGSREQVLAAAHRLRDELDAAIGAMEAACEPEPHRIVLSVRGADPEPWGSASYTITHPRSCDALAYGQRCPFDAARRVMPQELGVYDATVRGDGVEFTWVRDLAPEDHHG